MSNIDIDKIYGEDALKQVDLMNSKLAENVAQVDKIASAAAAMNKAFSGGSGSGVKEQIKDIDILAKQTEKLAFVSSDQGKALAMVAEQIRQVNAENKIAAQYNLAEADSIAKAEAELKMLNAQYVKRVKLGKENSESAKNELATIVALTDALKAENKTRGITTKLVGDYAGQLKGLEVQIKNNITAYNNLTDAEKRSTVGSKLKTDTADLGKAYYNMANGVSSGTTQMLKFEEVIKKQPSGLDKVASSVGGVWSVIRQAAYILPGLGIAGIMGIVFSGIGEVIEKMGILNDRIKEFKNTLLEGAKASTIEVVELDRLYKKSQDVTKSISERKEAVDKLQELYPAYFKNIKDENILNGNAKGIYDDLKTSIIEVAKAKAVESKIAEIINDGMEKELKYTDELKRAKARAALDKGKITSGPTEYDADGTPHGTTIDDKERNRLVKVAQDRLDTFRMEQREKLKIYEDFLNDTKAIELKHAPTHDPNPQKVKEINRISDLEDAYKAEKLIIDKKNQDGLFTEIEYRTELLKLIKEYATKKQDVIKNLSEHENNSATSFNNSLLSQTEQNNKAIESYYAKQAKMMDDYDKEIKHQTDEETKLKKKQKDYFEKLDDEEEKEGKARRERIISDKEQKAEDEKRLKKEVFNTEKQLLESAFDISRTITDAIAEREQRRFDAREKALKASYDNELRFIEQSGMSSAQKEKAKQKLQAETEAKQKQIDHDRITALRKAATIQKAIDIASIIAKTAIAVMADLAIPIYGEAKAIATAAAGAASLAAVIATPLPAYAKGRGKTGKGEFAIVGEGNGGSHEAIMRADGSVEITPNKATVAYIGPNDQVKTNSELMSAVMNAAYIRLAGSGKGATTNALEAAVVDKLDDILQENQQLRKALVNKQFNANSNSSDGYRAYKYSHIHQ